MECEDGASADVVADDVEAAHKATLNTPQDALDYWNWALETVTSSYRLPVANVQRPH